MKKYKVNGVYYDNKVDALNVAKGHMTPIVEYEWVDKLPLDNKSLKEVFPNVIDRIKAVLKYYKCPLEIYTSYGIDDTERLYRDEEVTIDVDFWHGYTDVVPTDKNLIPAIREIKSYD